MERSYSLGTRNYKTLSGAIRAAKRSNTTRCIFPNHGGEEFLYYVVTNGVLYGANTDTDNVRLRRV